MNTRAAFLSAIALCLLVSSASAQVVAPPLNPFETHGQLLKALTRADSVMIYRIQPTPFVRKADTTYMAWALSGTRVDSVKAGKDFLDGLQQQLNYAGECYSPYGRMIPRCWECDANAQYSFLVRGVSATEPVAIAFSFVERAAAVYRLRPPSLAGALGYATVADNLYRVFAQTFPAAEESLFVLPIPRAEVVGSSPLSADQPVDVLPKPIDPVKPVYPAAARQQIVQGTVMVEAYVGPKGKVWDAYIVKSILLLDQAALDAVKQWRFQPATYQGKPVGTWIQIPIEFQNVGTFEGNK